VRVIIIITLLTASTATPPIQGVPFASLQSGLSGLARHGISIFLRSLPSDPKALRCLPSVLVLSAHLPVCFLTILFASLSLLAPIRSSSHMQWKACITRMTTLSTSNGLRWGLYTTSNSTTTTTNKRNITHRTVDILTMTLLPMVSSNRLGSYPKTTTCSSLGCSNTNSSQFR